MRIAVISDIHSARAPFAAALADARREGFDQLVLLGDMFTYGIEPEACADLAAAAVARDGALLVGGNHDVLYCELADGVSTYADSLPEWIRESIDWTFQRLGRRWPDELAWVDQWAWDGMLFAHANPFGFGDWTPLGDEAALEAATCRLEERGFRCGVFGHVHRPTRHCNAAGIESHVVGSIGQPRNREDPAPQWAMIHAVADQITVSQRRVTFDACAYRAGIQAASALSSRTRDQLCRYFA
ncbi:metallophosphoesterase family protein [Novosphingobium lentum]|uniref:metallophosphoesterase family protein n=1 Tax=Novosphingobium lentum TaxID=145287 RepID=UPI00082BE313|nr:metallophosphoesterase family protein [Novosphingobium lentum]